VAWGAVGESVVANDTRANLEALMRTAGETGISLVISPHRWGGGADDPRHGQPL